MHPSIDIEEAINTSSIIVDVRSEKEYLQGHIPGAINIPLLNNEERVIIGTTYRHKGSEEAIRQGYEIVGPRFPQIKQDLINACTGDKIVIHCWRGGKRSEISCDLAREAGIHYQFITGGYKSYRRWCYRVFAKKQKVYVISGTTGSGKTELLYLLNNKKYQIIDLEKYAHHKGSAFGALGEKLQPTQETFENNLAQCWYSLDSSKPVFIENESRMVGKRYVPSDITKQIIDGYVIEIEVPYELRFQHICREYGAFPKQDLINCSSKLKKRLGNLRLQNIVSSIEQNTTEWITILLHYYDKCYEHSKIKRQQKIAQFVNGDNLYQICDKICFLVANIENNK